jgi:hypothetical protein
MDSDQEETSSPHSPNSPLRLAIADCLLAARGEIGTSKLCDGCTLQKRRRADFSRQIKVPNRQDKDLVPKFSLTLLLGGCYCFVRLDVPITNLLWPRPLNRPLRREVRSRQNWGFQEALHAPINLQVCT